MRKQKNILLSTFGIISAVLLAVAVIIVVYKISKKRKTEKFTAQCQSLLTSTPPQSWSLVTDITVYENLTLQTIQSSGVQSLAQGVLQSGCFPSVSFYFSGESGASSVYLQSPALLNGDKYLFTESSDGDYYQSLGSQLSVYLFPSCTQSSVIPEPTPFFEENNSKPSNFVSVGNTSMKLYSDSMCTIPCMVQSILTGVLPTSASVWYPGSKNLQVQAWGPVTVGFSKTVNGRFPSLYTAASPVETTLTTYVDNKIFQLEASSENVSAFSIFIYNTHTKVQVELTVSLIEGIAFVTSQAGTDSAGNTFVVNSCVQRITSAVDINGQKLSETSLLVIGPEIYDYFYPSTSGEPVSVEAPSFWKNPSPVNPQIADAADPNPEGTERTVGSLLLSSLGGFEKEPRFPSPYVEHYNPNEPGAPPREAPQWMIRQYLLTNLPRSFDWRNVGNGRIETIPRNQRDSPNSLLFALASYIGDQFSLLYDVEPTYPSAYGFLSAVEPEGAPSPSRQTLLFGSVPSTLAAPNVFTHTEVSWPTDALMDLYEDAQGFIGREGGDFSNQGVNGNSDTFSLIFGIRGLWNTPVFSHALSTSQRYTEQTITNIIQAIKKAIIERGPMITSMVVGDNFQNYWDTLGTIQNPAQRQNAIWQPVSLGRADHPFVQHVIIVGWGVTTGANQTPYWILRNFWGSEGDQGYFRVAMATLGNQNIGCPELPWRGPGVVVPGPAHINISSYQPGFIQGLIDAQVLVPTQPPRYDAVDQDDVYIPTCAPDGTCNTVGGGRCYSVLAPLPGNGPQPDAPHQWVVRAPTRRGINSFTAMNIPMEYTLRPTEGLGQVIDFVRRNPIDNLLIPEQGILITNSQNPLLGRNWEFRFNQITGIYYHVITGLGLLGVITIAPACWR